MHRCFFVINCKKDRKKGVLECMIKTYVIDTNVLIQAPYAIKRL